MDLYADAIAAHYAAYRPSLHAQILKRALPLGERFAVGLDVGCGTGYSALALADWCDYVHAVDPSQAMLDRAMPHPRVAYQNGAAERLPLPDASVDLVTFAGSLAYVDRDATAAELRRVCRSGATVVCYDFEVLLGDVLSRWNVADQAVDMGYDHAVNFADVPGFSDEPARVERAKLEVTAVQLAHVLLSDAHRFARFAEVLGTSNPFDTLKCEIESGSGRAELSADLYSSTYRM